MILIKCNERNCDKWRLVLVKEIYEERVGEALAKKT